MLEKIMEEIDDLPVITDMDDGCLLKYADVEDIIRKHMNDDWIPAEERLPKIEGVYDVTVINGKGESVVCTWQFLSGEHLSGKQTYVDGVHYWASNYTGDPVNKSLSQNVIAWRERPKPYRPKKGEK